MSNTYWGIRFGYVHPVWGNTFGLKKWGDGKSNQFTPGRVRVTSNRRNSKILGLKSALDKAAYIQRVKVEGLPVIKHSPTGRRIYGRTP